MTAGIALLAATAPMGTGQMMSTMAMPAAGAPAAAQDAPVATGSITIQNFALAPATATVKAGTTLTWTNHDQDTHPVSATSGPPHSPTLTTGQSYRYTFTTPWQYDYLCTIHRFMTATMVVTRGD